MAGAVTCVWDLKAELGEGPVWSATDHAVWFVDIKGRRIHRFDVETTAKSSWVAPEQVGFLAPLADGCFVAGLKSGLHRFDPVAESFTLLRRIESPELDNRLNDGFVDAQGRLWFGSMHDGETNATGVLYRLDHGAAPAAMDLGYAITNGPTISPDGATLYHCDTRECRIYAFDLAPDGSLANRRVFVRITRPGAFPDGPAVDSEGCVWVALFGGWGLDRYAPTGELIGRIDLPVANPTKAAFGGPDLKTLYITTARLHLDEDQRRAQPLAGGLFAVRVDTPGLPQNVLSPG